MAHNTTKRHNLATSMDPTLERHQQPLPKSSTAADPDLTLASSNATINYISKHFANLYSNHKHLKGSSLDSSCPALTKSKSLHGRGLPRDGETIKKSHKDPSFIKKSSGEIKEVKVKKELGFEEVKKRPSVSLEMGGGGGGGGGRRRSFCSSQIELSDFFSCNSVKVVSVDMPPFMQVHAVNCARKVYDSLEKFTSKALALSLKKEFDGVYGPAWHCIVGTSFGSFVTHSVGGFMYFSMDHKLYVLLFKTTVQRAD